MQVVLDTAVYPDELLFGTDFVGQDSTWAILTLDNAAFCTVDAGSSWTALSFFEGENTVIRDIVFVSNDICLAGTADGIYQCNLSSNQHTLIVEDIDVTSLLLKDKTLYAGTVDDGLYVVPDINAAQIKPVQQNLSLFDNSTDHIIRGKDGRVTVCSNVGRILVLDEIYGAWKLCFEIPLDSISGILSINGIAATDSAVFVATNHGLWWNTFSSKTSSVTEPQKLWKTSRLLDLR